VPGNGNHLPQRQNILSRSLHSVPKGDDIVPDEGDKVSGAGYSMPGNSGDGMPSLDDSLRGDNMSRRGNNVPGEPDALSAVSTNSVPGRVHVVPG
jgi:hypothetical protein